MSERIAYSRKLPDGTREEIDGVKLWAEHDALAEAIAQRNQALREMEEARQMLRASQLRVSGLEAIIEQRAIAAERALAEMKKRAEDADHEVGYKMAELAEARELLERWGRPVMERSTALLRETRAFLDPRPAPARCPCLAWEPEVRGSRSYHVPGCEYAPALPLTEWVKDPVNMPISAALGLPPFDADPLWCVSMPGCKYIPTSSDNRGDCCAVCHHPKADHADTRPAPREEKP